MAVRRIPFPEPTLLGLVGAEISVERVAIKHVVDLPILERRPHCVLQAVHRDFRP